MDPVVQMQEISKQPAAKQVQLTPEQQENSAVATMYALTGYDLNAETQPALIGAADALRLGKMMLDKEFWERDVRGNAETSALNWAAMVAGLPADMASMASSLLASGGSLEQAESTYSQYQPSSPTWVDVPGNSTQIAEAIGGDPNHPSFLVNSLVAQGPIGTAKTVLSLAKGGMIGMINVGRRAAPTLGRYSDFIAKQDVKPYDAEVFRETGWFKDDGGNPKFHLSSENAKLKDLNNNKKVQRLRERAAETGGPISSSNKPFYLEEILDYPELYEIYPELKKMRVELALEANSDTFSIVNRRNLKTRGGINVTGDNVVDRMYIENASDPDDFMNTLLHETEHVVQQIEGYAIGGNSEFVPEHWKDLTHSHSLEDAYKLIDDGIEAPDDLYWELLDKGVEAPDAHKIVADPLTQSYMAADEATRADAWKELDISQGLAYDEIGFVLEYLFRSKDRVPRGLDLVKELEEKLSMADMIELHHRAYLNLYGEAESRLSGATARMTQREIEQQGPLNPRLHAPDRTQDEKLIQLSYKEGKPSTVAQYDPEAALYETVKNWTTQMSTKAGGQETIDELSSMLRLLNKGGEETTGVSTAELLRAFEEIQKGAE
jgi:hypothetical protein